MPQILQSIAGSLQALLTPLIAIVTVYIAYQQYRIRRDERALQIYDRRLKIYVAASTILDKIRAGNAFTTEEVWEWESSLKEADFLFGPEVEPVLEALFGVVFDYASASEPAAVGGTYTVEAADAASRVEGLRMPLVEVFAPYLRPTGGGIRRRRRLSVRKAKKLVDEYHDTQEVPRPRPEGKPMDERDVPF